MIVWIASYPRSGNTFLRVVLHNLYRVPTYSIYQDNDPVAQRVGPSLVGYRSKPADQKVMIENAEIYFVKTHKRRKADRYPAIYLVRDGRDAVVSHARLRASQQAENGDKHAFFERLLREEIIRPYVEGQPSSGTWGGNVLNWLDHNGAPLAVIRYEDLIVNPRSTVERAVSSLLPNLIPIQGASIPTFSSLHDIDPLFFRRGKTGSHQDEMSDELQDLFWSQPENVTAMNTLGYHR